MKWFNKIVALFRRHDVCRHGFKIKDVMNLEKEPRCIGCNRTLSELKEEIGI